MTPQQAARLIADRGLAELFRTALPAIRSLSPLSAKEGKGRALRGDPATVIDGSRC